MYTFAPSAVAVMEPRPPSGLGRLGAYAGFTRDEWIDQALRFWDAGTDAIYRTLREVGLTDAEANEVIIAAAQIKDPYYGMPADDTVMVESAARAPYLGFSVDEWVAQALRFWDAGPDAILSTLLNVGLTSAEAMTVFDRAQTLAPQPVTITPPVTVTPPVTITPPVTVTPPVTITPPVTVTPPVTPLPVEKEIDMTQAEIDAIAAVNPTVLKNVKAELQRRLPDTPITDLDAAYWANQGGIPAVRAAFPLASDSMTPTPTTTTTGGPGLGAIALAAAAYFLLS